MKKNIDKRIRSIDEEIDRWRIKFKDDNAFKVKEDVFDEYALKTLYTLSKREVLQAMGGIISRGKEANVFLADGKENEIAVKIYRITTSSFNSMEEYIIGDPRFKNIRHTKREIVFAWTRKEYRNLKRAYEAGVRVPYPIIAERNILVMEFLGKKGISYPLLKHTDIDRKQAENIFSRLIEYMHKLYQEASLIHADLSEYNIMIDTDNMSPIIIDMGQSTTPEHPRAKEFLIRDIENILKFFRRYGIDADPDDLYTSIVNDRSEKKNSTGEIK